MTGQVSFRNDTDVILIGFELFVCLWDKQMVDRNYARIPKYFETQVGVLPSEWEILWKAIFRSNCQLLETFKSCSKQNLLRICCDVLDDFNLVSVEMKFEDYVFVDGYWFAKVVEWMGIVED